MAGAALGWGVYTLRGRSSTAPTQATAANFMLATPVAVMLWLLMPDTTPAAPQGIALAVTSGAIASGIGYALWYAVLPALKSTQAAILQLAVPVIALAGGVLLLGEPFTWLFVLAATLVMVGVVVALKR